MQFNPFHLAALTAVLRRGSFELAAADLVVTPSAISQRVKALEDQVGAALIQRGSPCTGTDTGVRLAKHAGDVGLLEAQLSRDLALEDTGGDVRLRIAINADSLATWFVAAMAEVPNVLFDLVIDDQDHSADWLRRGEVSAAITSGGKPVTGCDSVPLGSLRYIATASPDFTQHWFGNGVTAATLAKAPCITFNAKDALQRSWMFQQTGQRISPPTHYLPSSQTFVDASCAGLGWGMNPEYLIHGPLLDTRLVALIPNAPLDVPLTWQISRIMAPSLKPVTHAVQKAARKILVAAQDATTLSNGQSLR